MSAEANSVSIKSRSNWLTWTMCCGVKCTAPSLESDSLRPPSIVSRGSIQTVLTQLTDQVYVLPGGVNIGVVRIDDRRCILIDSGS